jgi:hypothetical protein
MPIVLPVLAIVIFLIALALIIYLVRATGRDYAPRRPRPAAPIQPIVTYARLESRPAEPGGLDPAHVVTEVPPPATARTALDRGPS